MKQTRALCDICYKEIAAVADPFSTEDISPMIYKVCPEHGIQRGKLESDREFYREYSIYERNNHYSVLIINVTDRCNIKCKHCFYPIKNQWDMNFDNFKRLVTYWRQYFKMFILSGGDPTCWEHYYEAAEWCRENDIVLSQLTNGVKFAETETWQNLRRVGYIRNNYLLAEMSIHPTNISEESVRAKQLEVLAKMKEEKVKMSCIMMNVDTKQKSSIEIDQVMEEIVDFMSEWKDVTTAFRIRPICFDAWGATTKGVGYFLSDIVKSLVRTCARKGIEIQKSFNKDVDNIYNQNFKMLDVDVVTVCAANVHSLDLGYLNRGPFMLANDGQPYSVPHCLIINEGIDKGWYNGNRVTCQ